MTEMKVSEAIEILSQKNPDDEIDLSFPCECWTIYKRYKGDCANYYSDWCFETEEIALACAKFMNQLRDMDNMDGSWCYNSGYEWSATWLPYKTNGSIEQLMTIEEFKNEIWSELHPNKDEIPKLVDIGLITNKQADEYIEEFCKD